MNIYIACTATILNVFYTAAATFALKDMERYITNINEQNKKIRNMSYDTKNMLTKNLCRHIFYRGYYIAKDHKVEKELTEHEYTKIANE